MAYNTFNPGQSILNGANSLTAAGSTEPTLWQKAKGKTSSLFDDTEQDLGVLYKDTNFEDPANDELLGVIADVDTELYKKDDGLPWADIVKSGFDAVSLLGKDAKSVTSSAHRPGFRGAQLPAQQYDIGALQNQMAAKEFQSFGAGDNLLDLNGLLKQAR